ncbi:MAG: restriction endonuclease subunit S, partial [bacterium]
NINTTSFSNIRINKPEKDILRKFDEVVEPLFEKILNNLIEIEKLRIIRDFLVLKLMTGRIRVNEKRCKNG